MSRTLLAPITIPATRRDYTAAIDARSIGGDVRLQLDATAAADDAAAVFICDDPALASGTVASAFSGSDPSTWPPHCTLVATLAAGEVRRLPDQAWGRAVVVLRTVGSTGNVLLSGHGSLGGLSVAAPTTVGAYTASTTIATVRAPARIGFDADATSADVAEVYLTDATFLAGTGAPPASQYFGTIVGGGADIILPPGTLASRVSLRRTAGTAARNVGISGTRESTSAPLAHAAVTGTATTTGPATLLDLGTFTPTTDAIMVDLSATIAQNGNGVAALFEIVVGAVVVASAGFAPGAAGYTYPFGMRRRIPVTPDAAIHVTVQWTPLQGQTLTCAPGSNAQQHAEAFAWAA